MELTPTLGEMINKCAVNGTTVEFHCTGATVWHIGSLTANDGTPPLATLTLTASMDSESSSSEMDFITCQSSQHGITDASLITLGKLLN